MTISRKLLFPSLVLGLLALSVPLDAQVLPIPDGDGGRIDVQRYRAEAYQDYVAVVEAWRAAWRAGDAEAAARLYTDDASFAFHADRVINGREAIEAGIGPLMERFPDFQTVHFDYEVRDRLAFGMGTFDVPAGGEPGSGVFTMVVRREGRNWRIRAQSFTLAD